MLNRITLLHVAMVLVALLLVAFGNTPVLAQADTEQVDLEIIESAAPVPLPDNFTVRARILKITPNVAGPLRWKYGAEGVGGRRVSGDFVRADTVDAPMPGKKPQDPAKQRLIPVGQWTKPIPIKDFGRKTGSRLILTIMAGTNGERTSLSPLTFEGYSRGIEAEFEFRIGNKVIKTVKEGSESGNVFGLVIPLNLLKGDVRVTSPEFAEELGGLLDYERRRRIPLENAPYGKWARPDKLLIIDNVVGYKPFNYHGVRYSSQKLVYEMYKTLRLLGVNGSRSAPAFLEEDILHHRGIGAELTRGMIIHGMGYAVPSKARGSGPSPEGAGCPYHPGVAERQAEGVKNTVEHALHVPVDEVWSLTVDEIGTVIDRSVEGKGHLAACELCQKGFQEWLASIGMTPADFDRTTWHEVVPLDVWGKKGKRDAMAKPWLKGDVGTAMMAYYTRRFNCYVSAKLFTPLRDAFKAANDAKLAAMADPAKKGSDVAKQPFIRSYALRGCTFLYAGHSLDFFNFYRNADNAVVYETSNRDPRIWQWDSYLCDVARSIGREVGIDLGIIIKPHRGAVVQRALTSVSRGAKMIYWYNFGPEYAKGDSYSSRPENLILTSKAAALLGRTDDVLFGAEWMAKPEVGIISPRSSEIWAGLGALPVGGAGHENAKFTHQALSQAHIPLDALDEQMLVRDDLSAYKVLYVLGPHLRRDAARKLADWVKAGGTLYTAGYGLVRSEANTPLNELAPALGLQGRGDAEMYVAVRAYGATSIQDFEDKKSNKKPTPAGAEIIGKGDYATSFVPVVGREVLKPVAGAEVLASFKDGGAAMIRHRFGKGQVYVCGFWPALEYTAKVRQPEYDMGRDYDPALLKFIAGPALAAGVKPVVDASSPMIEGVLLRNPDSGKRAVTLMNWGYGIVAKQKYTTLVRGQAREGIRNVRGHLPLENVTVTICGAGPVKTVKSAMLDEPVAFETKGDTVVVKLPKLEEGDVLLLD